MRKALIQRQTRETNIELELNLEQPPEKDTITSGVPFLDHMLELLSFHGAFYLRVRASGDTEVDDHHTVEDIGICLGQALREALGDKKGIARYGFCVLPMDEARAEISLDISGRPFLRMEGKPLQGRTGRFDSELVEEFFRALVNNAALCLHIVIASGMNLHHMIEAVFKGTGRALKSAWRIEHPEGATPSTKGVL